MAIRSSVLFHYMRLDKYLKNSRIIKRRTVAKDACDHGRVEVNDRIAKAGQDVKPGDIIRITFGNKELAVKVVSVPENVRKDDAQDLYEVIN